MKLIDDFKKSKLKAEEKEISIEDFLSNCKKDKTLWESPADRMLRAIGEPTIIDTNKAGGKIARVFGNRKIKVYDAFYDFYGMEDIIENLVSYFTKHAQGLEESKQIIYLLGPVGSAKSSIMERLKTLYQQQPIYVLKCGDELSPVFESPLGFFDETYSDKLHIPEYRLKFIPSPWASKRLKENGNDLSKFSVVKMYPSVLDNVAITSLAPGDENTSDISTLVGKVNIRKLEFHNQNSVDAYLFNGALNRANQGLFEFIEMFKAPIKLLHPLLTATQEHVYHATEALPAIPFDGIISAHSNLSEWEAFKNNSTNEAFIDRCCVIKVPYNVRYEEEIKIYEKLLRGSELHDANIAPYTLKMLAQWSVMSRLSQPDASTLYAKMKVYNGENIKEKVPDSKPITEYKDRAGVMESMGGMSTRFAFKVLAQTFNYDADELAANPVHLIAVLTNQLKQELVGEDRQSELLTNLKSHIVPDFAEHLETDLQKAYLESYSEYGQNLFDNYIHKADHWLRDEDFRDPDTGEIYNLKLLDEELDVLEMRAEISNAKDFRSEVVNYVFRYQAQHKGEMPSWTAYAKLRRVIEKTMFEQTEDLLPTLTFDSSSTDKHEPFLKRMNELGYTTKQARLAVDWLRRYKSNS